MSWCALLKVASTETEPLGVHRTPVWTVRCQINATSAARRVPPQRLRLSQVPLNLPPPLHQPPPPPLPQQRPARLQQPLYIRGHRTTSRLIRVHLVTKRRSAQRCQSRTAITTRMFAAAPALTTAPALRVR